jgi:hypothetical protein
VLFVVFFTDSAQPSLLRNNHTQASVRDGELRFPCTPTHHDSSNINLELRDPNGKVLSGNSILWNPIDGFTLHMERSVEEYYGIYSCSMKVNGNEVDMMNFPFQKDMKGTKILIFSKY